MDQDKTPGDRAGNGELCLRLHATLGAQAVTPSPKRWSPAAEERFLDELATSASARRAAEAAGFSEHGIYARRRKHPEFAEKWRIAREQGVARIELALIRAAEHSLEGLTFDDSRPIPKMSVAEAIAVVRMFGEHGERARNGRRAANWLPRDPDKARAEILLRVAMVRRAKGYDR